MTLPPRYEVVLTAGAQADLIAINDYLVGRGAVGAANKLLDDFRAAIGTLELFPARGALPKELEEIGMRDWHQLLVGPYRVIYGIAAAQVTVSVIIDGRRDLPRLLESRLLRG